MDIVAFLKDRPEINLSGIARAARVPVNKLSGAEYEKGGKIYTRKLTGDQEQRVIAALQALRDALNGELPSSASPKG